jgi:NifU-like protein involved in Fe-S cluster formation
MALNASSKLLRVVEPLKVLSAAYHPNVIEHYENPRNVGSMDKNDKTVGTGLVGAPACGDVMKLQIKVDENGKIVDANIQNFRLRIGHRQQFFGYRVGEGQNRGSSLQLKNTDIAKELSLPPVKLHCSMLAEDAIKAALSDYKIKQKKEKN